MIKANYHTHSIFCDGKDTIEELCISAIKQGFLHLGYSGHSYLENADGCTMDDIKIVNYYDEIHRVMEKYEGKINIYCGIEQDCFSKKPILNFEYKIGSVHNIKKNGKFLFFDYGMEHTLSIINKNYQGSYLSFAKDYFETVSNVIDLTGAEIIGHFDLCSKFNERLGNFESEEYLEYAEKAVKKLLQTGAIFEINTGAMARGYRTSPYPSFEILKMIYNGGGKIIINSDCHNKNYLDYAFDSAIELAKKVGFKKRNIITKNGFIEIDL